MAIKLKTLSGFISGFLYPYRVDSVGIEALFIHSPSNFTGPKIIGQLDAQMFLGQVSFLISSCTKEPVKGLKLILGVSPAYGVCSCLSA